MPSILALEEKINELKNDDRTLFKKFSNIYEITSNEGLMVIPESFQEKVWQYFGAKHRTESTESRSELINILEKQKIVQIFNKWTYEGSLFNSLRAQRPGMTKSDKKYDYEQTLKYINKNQSNCDFCQPEIYTPEDTFGRIIGKHSITASNIAKYDAWSSVLIFREHNPLEFNLNQFSDYLTTAVKWFEKVIKQDPGFKFPFFLWNCLSKAGGSIVHGHAQILASKQPYAKVRLLIRARDEYRSKYGSNYFHDLFKIHEYLELTRGDENLGTLVSITPLKEKELMVLCKESPYEDDEIKKLIYNNLKALINKMGVHSFNLAISDISTDNESQYVIRIVDRGSIFKEVADMGSMELYGSSVIASDPCQVIKNLN
jgi:hypothetical protein